jgi:hypothetical protein
VVPIHSQNDTFQVLRFVARDDKPDMGNDTRAIRIEKRECRAGSNNASIIIRAGWIRTRGAMRDVSLLSSYIGLPGDT